MTTAAQKAIQRLERLIADTGLDGNDGYYSGRLLDKLERLRESPPPAPEINRLCDWLEVSLMAAFGCSEERTRDEQLRHILDGVELAGGG